MLLKFRGFDAAGNKETAANATSTYLSGGVVLNIAGIDQTHIGTAGPTVSNISWTSNELGFGLSYEIRLGATDCSSGSVIASGGMALNNSEAISVGSLPVIGPHNIMICASNISGGGAGFGVILWRDN